MKTALNEVPIPAKGPGSRQPKIKLPMLMPNGKKTTSHPLLWLLKERMPEYATKSTVAQALGVKPQSLYKWEHACRKDRNFPVPIMRAKQLGEFFNVPASMLRPDAFKDEA
jgi:DNA-binding XRE family transcriptional regulator